MPTIDAHPPTGESDAPTRSDYEHALTIWRALLPTWTHDGARFRNPAALVAALTNPLACRIVADRLTALRAGVAFDA